MLETRIVHASGVVAVPLVVSITVEMAKSRTLGMVKAIVSGKGEVIDLARTNLRRQWEIRVGGAPLSAVAASAALRATDRRATC
jgi:hypothetical protein